MSPASTDATGKGPSGASIRISAPSRITVIASGSVTAAGSVEPLNVRSAHTSSGTSPMATTRSPARNGVSGPTGTTTAPDDAQDQASLGTVAPSDGRLIRSHRNAPSDTDRDRRGRDGRQRAKVARSGSRPRAFGGVHRAEDTRPP